MTKHLIRLPGWWIASVLAFIAICYLAPQQIGVLTYKTLQVTFGVGLAYLADRALFRFVVPLDEISHDAFGASRIIARALVVLAVLIALSLGI